MINQEGMKENKTMKTKLSEPLEDDPKIDTERMKQWKANILPVPSAERLKEHGIETHPDHWNKFQANGQDQT